MISFRYHVFTIVAIFLAVALGIAVGNAYVRPALVDSLRKQTEQLRTDLHDLQGRVGDLDAQVRRWQRAGNVLSVLDNGRMKDEKVVVVTQSDVDPAVLAQALTAFDTAGAKLIAVLSATPRLALQDKPSESALARVLGVPNGGDPQALQDEAANALGVRLAAGGPREAGSSPTDDLLYSLLTADPPFLASPEGSPRLSPSDLRNVGGHGEIVVVVAGNADQTLIDPADFAVPLVTTLVQQGATVAAAQGSTAAQPFVQTIRGDSGLKGHRMVTVDDLDLSIGGAALVLGLERLIGLGDGGDYGIDGGPPDVTTLPPP